MQQRLAGLLPDFTSEIDAGLHHLNTSHQAERDRVATPTRFWHGAEAR